MPLSATATPATRPGALAAALTRLDSNGRFSPGDAATVRQVAHAVRFGSREELDHPANLFGRWETVPTLAQAAFRRLVEREIVGTMRWFPRGSLWTGAVRRCWEADRYIAETQRFRSLRPHVIGGANRLSALPMNLSRRARRWVRMQGWQRGSTPSLDALLESLGREPHWLCGDFVQGVRVDPRAMGFHADTARKAFVGYHLGLDLMPTDEGLICLEGNLQVGFMTQHPSLQPHSPTAHGLLAAAQAHGVRSIAWMEGHRKPVEQWFMAEMAKLGEPHEISTSFHQDPRIPAPREWAGTTFGDLPRRSWWSTVPRDTLVVRRNEFPVGSDYLINHKEPFVRALQAEFSGRPDAPVKLLPQTRRADIAPGSFERGLPNLVYKYPDGLAGDGVFFMRVRTVDDAHHIARALDARTGEPPGVFQRFVPPQPSATGSAKDYRAEILITPLGTWFLGAVRRVAALRMPECVTEGLVDAPGAFTSNLLTGGVLERVSPEEVDMLAPASVAVGDALRRALSKTFVTGDLQPSGLDHSMASATRLESA